MGHEVIIHGRILGARGSVGENFRRLQEYNRTILNELPRHDDEWPWLVRGMFALPVGWPQGTYRQQVIHFGASLKDDPYDRSWIDRWLDKFEALLRRLYWSSARLYLETEFEGVRCYEWQPTPAAWQRLYQEPPQPVSEWTREMSEPDQGS